MGENPHQLPLPWWPPLHSALLLISCDQINRIKERGEEIEIMIDYCYSLLRCPRVRYHAGGKQVAVGGHGQGGQM